MTLDELIQHIVMLHHDKEIKSLCVSIIDSQGRIQTATYIPPELALVAPTGVALLHSSTMINVVNQQIPMIPKK